MRRLVAGHYRLWVPLRLHSSYPADGGDDVCADTCLGWQTRMGRFCSIAKLGGGGCGRVCVNTFCWEYRMHSRIWNCEFCTHGRFDLGRVSVIVVFRNFQIPIEHHEMKRNVDKTTELRSIQIRSAFASLNDWAPFEAAAEYNAPMTTMQVWNRCYAHEDDSNGGWRIEIKPGVIVSRKKDNPMCYQRGLGNKKKGVLCDCDNWISSVFLSFQLSRLMEVAFPVSFLKSRRIPSACCGLPKRNTKTLLMKNDEDSDDWLMNWWKHVVVKSAGQRERLGKTEMNSGAIHVTYEFFAFQWVWLSSTRQWSHWIWSIENRWHLHSSTAHEKRTIETKRYVNETDCVLNTARKLLLLLKGPPPKLISSSTEHLRPLRQHQNLKSNPPRPTAVYEEVRCISTLSVAAIQSKEIHHDRRISSHQQCHPKWNLSKTPWPRIL